MVAGPDSILPKGIDRRKLPTQGAPRGNPGKRKMMLNLEKPTLNYFSE
jgi:hypothetical protein